MFLQLVEENYKDWKEHHAPTEVKFESRELTAGGRGRQQKYRRCEPSIQLKVTRAGKNESKHWDIHFINIDKVKEVFPSVII